MHTALSSSMKEVKHCRICARHWKGTQVDQAFMQSMTSRVNKLFDETALLVTDALHQWLQLCTSVVTPAMLMHKPAAFEAAVAAEA